MPGETGWRRKVDGSDHGRAWAGIGLGALVTFLFVELTALANKTPLDTASEAVWSALPPFGLWWWFFIPPFTGLCAWLPVHFGFRWGGPWELLWCVLAAYLALFVVYLIFGRA